MTWLLIWQCGQLGRNVDPDPGTLLSLEGQSDNMRYWQRRARMLGLCEDLQFAPGEQSAPKDARSTRARVLVSSVDQLPVDYDD